MSMYFDSLIIDFFSINQHYTMVKRCFYNNKPFIYGAYLNNLFVSTLDDFCVTCGIIW